MYVFFLLNDFLILTNSYFVVSKESSKNNSTTGNVRPNQMNKIIYIK